MEMSVRELEDLHRASSFWIYDSKNCVYTYRINNKKYFDEHVND